MRVMVISIKWNDPQELRKLTGEIEDSRQNQNYSDDSIFKNDKNTQKSPGERRRHDIYHSESNERPTSNAGVKNS